MKIMKFLMSKQLLLPDEVKLKCYLTRAVLPLREIFPVTVVPFNTVTNNGPKKIGRINEGFFFLQENVWWFSPGGQKKVAVILRRWP